MRYIKKPIAIDAIPITQLRWLLKTRGADLLPAWLREGLIERHAFTIYEEVVVVHTVEGNMTGRAGDYLVRGVHGEFYPVKGEIFESTYDLVEAA